MSLLDALQAAGAIDKKAAAKAKREAKKARKRKHGNLDKKKVIQAKAEEDEHQSRRLLAEQKRSERIAREAQTADTEARLRAINLVAAWRINISVTFKTALFSFENLEGITEQVNLPPFIIKGLENGSLGLARIDGDTETAVLPKGAMVKIKDAYPAAVLYLSSAL